MITIALTDAQVASIVQQFGSSPPPVASPPVASPPTALLLPAEIAGRSQMTTIFPWTHARIIAPAANNDANVWLVKLKAGPAQRDVTMQFAEAQGGGIARYALLIRDRDSAVIWRQDASNSKGVSTISAMMTFSTLPQPTGIFAAAFAKTVIATGESYTFALWNVPGNPAGLMLAELLL
jgi:hypothetical protein